MIKSRIKFNHRIEIKINKKRKKNEEAIARNAMRPLLTKHGTVIETTKHRKMNMKKCARVHPLLTKCGTVIKATEHGKNKYEHSLCSHMANCASVRPLLTKRGTVIKATNVN